MEWLWSPLGIAVVWLALHSADYLLTVAAARLRARGNLAERLQLGGSLELNPIFQQAVDRGLWLSRRFLVTLALGAALLPVGMAYFHWTAAEVQEPAFSYLPEALCGGLVVTRFAVIAIHLQNIALFRRMLRVPEAAVVRVHYDRGSVMMMTRARKLELAAFTALAALLSHRPFFVGGFMALLGLVLAMHIWERRQAAAASRAQQVG